MDARCDVHYTVMPLREGRDGWFHLFCPGASSCNDEGDVYALMVKTNKNLRINRKNKNKSLRVGGMRQTGASQRIFLGGGGGRSPEMDSPDGFGGAPEFLKPTLQAKKFLRNFLSIMPNIRICLFSLDEILTRSVSDGVIWAHGHRPLWYNGLFFSSKHCFIAAVSGSDFCGR
jgi:hypothetical protein